MNQTNPHCMNCEDKPIVHNYECGYCHLSWHIVNPPPARVVWHCPWCGAENNFIRADVPADFYEHPRCDEPAAYETEKPRWPESITIDVKPQPAATAATAATDKDEETTCGC